MLQRIALLINITEKETQLHEKSCGLTVCMSKS